MSLTPPKSFIELFVVLCFHCFSHLFENFIHECNVFGQIHPCSLLANPNHLHIFLSQLHIIFFKAIESIRAASMCRGVGTSSESRTTYQGRSQGKWFSLSCRSQLPTRTMTSYLWDYIFRECLGCDLWGWLWNRPGIPAFCWLMKQGPTGNMVRVEKGPSVWKGQPLKGTSGRPFSLWHGGPGVVKEDMVHSDKLTQILRAHTTILSF